MSLPKDVIRQFVGGRGGRVRWPRVSHSLIIPWPGLQNRPQALSGMGDKIALEHTDDVLMLSEKLDKTPKTGIMEHKFYLKTTDTPVA